MSSSTAGTTGTELADFLEAVDDGVKDALREDGYTWEDEDSVHHYDSKAFARGVFDAVKDVRITKKEDRDSGALKKGELFRRVLPSFASPLSPEWDGDDPVHVEVYDRLDRKVWNEAKTDRSARLQRRCQREVKMVFCRARVPADDGQLTDAVYLTDVIELIKADYARPLRHSAERAAERLASNIAAVIETLPQHRKVLEKEVTDGMKTASTLAKTRLQLEAGPADEE